MVVLESKGTIFILFWAADISISDFAKMIVS